MDESPGGVSNASIMQEGWLTVYHANAMGDEIIVYEAYNVSFERFPRQRSGTRKDESMNDGVPQIRL